MRHANHSPPRKGGGGTAGGASFIRRCALIDLVAASFFSALVLFLLLAFTPLGDPLAASGRRYLGRQSASFARQREKVIAAIELGEEVVIESCPAEEVDKIPCEDPRRNSLFDRYMNFYRERHCPAPGEALLCLVPPPKGYRVRIPWPESLHKVRTVSFTLIGFQIKLRLHKQPNSGPHASSIPQKTIKASTVRQARHMEWMIYLQQFNLSIKYKKVVQNKMAKMLSRLFDLLSSTTMMQFALHEKYVGLYKIDEALKNVFEEA